MGRTQRKFGTALGDSAVTFFVYALSLLAALAWNSAVTTALAKYDKVWTRFVWAASFTMFALLMIAVIALYYDLTPNVSQTVESTPNAKDIKD